MRKFISRYNNFPQGLFILGGVACFVIFVTIFTNVVLRYIFDKPFHFAEELGGLLLLILTFAAAAEVLKRERHINSDVIYRLFRPKMKRIADFVIDAVILITGAILSWQGFEAAYLAFDLNLRLPSLMGTYLVLPYGTICLGFGFLAFQALLRIIERILPNE